MTDMVNAGGFSRFFKAVACAARGGARTGLTGGSGAGGTDSVLAVGARG